MLIGGIPDKKAVCAEHRAIGALHADLPSSRGAIAVRPRDVLLMRSMIGEFRNREHTALVVFRPESPGHAPQAPRPNKLGVCGKSRSLPNRCSRGSNAPAPCVAAPGGKMSGKMAGCKWGGVSGCWMVVDMPFCEQRVFKVGTENTQNGFEIGFWTLAVRSMQ